MADGTRKRRTSDEIKIATAAEEALATRLSQMQDAIQAASKDWPKPKVSRKGKTTVECPDCGARGAPGGKWTRAHVYHTTAPCGKSTSIRGEHCHRHICVRCRAIAAAP